jgi:hypothetical protein
MLRYRQRGAIGLGAPPYGKTRYGSALPVSPLHATRLGESDYENECQYGWDQ